MCVGMEEKILGLFLEQQEKRKKETEEETKMIKKQALREQEIRVENEIRDKNAKDKAQESSDKAVCDALMEQLKRFGGLDNLVSLLENISGKHIDI